ASKILWDEIEPGIDPLGLKNKLIMTTGPLTGTLCPGSGSWDICFKSPLTNVWGETRCGSSWGPELKYAGHDMVILEGLSEELVYIWICDGRIEIKPAKHLSGKNTHETEIALKTEVKDYEAKVACIGKAGENLVRYACVMSEDRAAGRCGAGAVMGSKNVKAIVVRGHGEISVSDPDVFSVDANETEELVKNKLRQSQIWKAGTIGFYKMYDITGEIPTKYGRSNTWGKLSHILPQFDKKYFIGNKACYGCTVGCGIYSEVKSGRWATPQHGGPEYETMALFSNLIMNKNLEATIHANYLCNTYGLDTISCANVIAFAMECRDRGWISKKDTDNIDLTYGNMDAVVNMMEKIVDREGFGAILAEGVRKAAKKIGERAPKIALHVKGLEIPAHDPRSNKTLALQYGTANRGMCHIHPIETHAGRRFELEPYGQTTFPDRYDEKGHGLVNKLNQDFGMLHEILGVCKFYAWIGPITVKRYARMLSHLVGWTITDVELLKTGERVLNLQRCFNVREGIRRKDDLLPATIRKIPEFGPYSRMSQTAIVNYNAMLRDYYEERGWNKRTGIPSMKKLKELELADIAEQLSTYL
ncbi:MAG: aldehyde ferredoxin oxidoreductase family protein, partial [Candidatus Bathyarchaeota archaeon]